MTRYWPLIRSALLRRPTEALLILLAVTFGFALFGFMIALNATVNRVIDAARDDRLYVNARFDTGDQPGLPIALEEQIKAMGGITGAGAFRWVNGYYQIPKNRFGVYTVDEGMRVAMAEYPISASQWDEPVRRRIPEFATLKALGYSDVQVTRLVLLEATIPCCLGAALGTGLAAAFVAVPQRYIPRDLSNVPHPAITLTTVAWALAFALLIAFFGSVLPISRLWRLNVAAAICGRLR